MRPIPCCAILVVVLAAAAPAAAAPLAADRPGGTATQATPDVTPLVVSIPHHLAEAEAERRVKDALAGLQKDYGYLLSIDRQVWRGPHLVFRATVFGQAARGRVDIDRDHVDVRVMMPSNLSVLVDLAQPVLLKQGTQLLAKQ